MVLEACGVGMLGKRTAAFTDWRITAASLRGQPGIALMGVLLFQRSQCL